MNSNEGTAGIQVLSEPWPEETLADLGDAKEHQSWQDSKGALNKPMLA